MTAIAAIAEFLSAVAFNLYGMFNLLAAQIGQGPALAVVVIAVSAGLTFVSMTLRRNDESAEISRRAELQARRAMAEYKRNHK